MTKQELSALNQPITIPVSATMTKQPDGSFKMTNAEYVETTAGVIAEFLLKRFHIPFEDFAEK